MFWITVSVYPLGSCDVSCAYNKLGVLENGGEGRVGIHPRLAGESSDSLDEGTDEGTGLNLQVNRIICLSLQVI